MAAFVPSSFADLDGLAAQSQVSGLTLSLSARPQSAVDETITGRWTHTGPTTVSCATTDAEAGTQVYGLRITNSVNNSLSYALGIDAENATVGWNPMTYMDPFGDIRTGAAVYIVGNGPHYPTGTVYTANTPLTLVVWSDCTAPVIDLRPIGTAGAHFMRFINDANTFGLHITQDFRLRFGNATTVDSTGVTPNWDVEFYRPASGQLKCSGDWLVGGALNTTGTSRLTGAVSAGSTLIVGDTSGSNVPRGEFDVNGNDINVESWFGWLGNHSSAALIQSHTQRVNFGNTMLGRNLKGTSGSDNYVTPSDQEGGAGGYSAIEFRSNGDMDLIAWTGTTTTNGVVTPQRVLRLGGANTIGFYTASPVAKQTVSGSRGGNAALASLLTALATTGLITDSSTA